MQYSDVLLLSKDNLLSNTLQTRISNLFFSNILEGANYIQDPSDLRISDKGDDWDS